MGAYIFLALPSNAGKIPNELLEKVHLEGLQASNRIKRGEEEIEVPDYGVRHKYLDTTYKLKGGYESDESKNNINVLMPVLVKFMDNKDEK